MVDSKNTVGKGGRGTAVVSSQKEAGLVKAPPGGEITFATAEQMGVLPVFKYDTLPELYDANTGEMMEAGVVEALLGPAGKGWVARSVFGFFPPLFGSILAGKMVSCVDVPSQLSRTGTQRVVTITGAARVYGGDSARFTSRKEDPEIDDPAFVNITGTWCVGLTAASVNMGEADIGKFFRFTFGRYVSRGAMTRKALDIFEMSDPPPALVKLAGG